MFVQCSSIGIKVAVRLAALNWPLHFLALILMLMILLNITSEWQRGSIWYT